MPKDSENKRIENYPSLRSLALESRGGLGRDLQQCGREDFNQKGGS